MKTTVKPGDRREYRRIVQSGDIASFHGKEVHPVCSTFSLARDIEWTTRLFVLDMIGPDEEGIGTFLTIEHKNPAFVGEEIMYTGWVDQLNGNELTCFYEARVGERLVAVGKTGQKIISRAKINDIFKAQGYLPTEQ
jgi:fluoroacetyl-CoA thioesterase